MQILLKRLSQNREKLSQLEKQVLDYILQNTDYITKLNLDELSKELYVSTATISRTCQQLGFRGFQDLKYTLSMETNKVQSPVSSTSYLLNTHMERMKEEMEKTLDYIDEEKIKLAASYLKQSTHVEIFGVGNSLPACVDASRKLMFAGKLCNARTDWDELRSAANSLAENDLAILVSYSGETLHMLEFAHILKKRNVKTIAITGSHSNRLQSEVSLSLQAYITSTYFGELDMTSRFPLSMVLDFIIIAYLNEMKIC